MRAGSVVPVLRMFDEAATRAFYVDFLGAEVKFEHRFGDNFPLYLGLSLGGVELHLTGHHGDACPGARVRISVQGLAVYAVALRSKGYRFAKPGLPESTPWGECELELTDPSGNRLTFVEDA